MSSIRRPCVLYGAVEELEHHLTGGGTLPSETGKQILSGLAETRRFFGQVSQLMQAADGMLAEEGWEAFSTNRCTDLTGSLLHPRRWMAQNIYRFYRLSDGDNTGAGDDIIIVLGVVLDRYGAWVGFQEPWLTFGRYQYFPGHNPWKFRLEDWIDVPLENKVDPDGTFSTWDNPENDPEIDEGLLHQAYGAVPLVSIQDASDIKNTVVDPLIEIAQARIAGFKGS